MDNNIGYIGPGSTFGVENVQQLFIRLHLRFSTILSPHYSEYSDSWRFEYETEGFLISMAVNLPVNCSL